MSAEWQVTTLKKAGVKLIDCDHKTPAAQESGYPYVGIPQLKNGRIDLEGVRLISEEDFHHWRRKAAPKADDVILSRRCNPGETAYVPDGLEIALGQNLVLLRSSENLLYPPFLRWVTQGPKWWEQISTFINVGAVFDSLKCADIPNFEIFLPPLSDQIKIDNILRAIDKKIELNRQINQTLEQIAQAIFKSWFVDFDPVKAKIWANENGHDPERAAMCALAGLPYADDALDHLSPEQQQQLATTAALFPNTLEESELGDIPSGWKVLPFGELLENTIGGDWGKDEPDDKHTEKVAILRGTDLPKVYAGDDSNVPARWVEKKKLASRQLKSGDIVIEVSGGSKDQPTGRSLYLLDEIINRFDTPAEPASFCRLFRPKTPDIGLMLSLHLRKIYAEGKTWQYQNQSTGISNFQTSVFLEQELVVSPSENITDAFAKAVKPLIRKICSGENQKLAQLRDALLPKLLSGELSVADLPEIADAEASV